MRNVRITFCLTMLIGLLLCSATAGSAGKAMKAVLGPFLFDRTTMKEARSTLGPGTAVPDSGPYRGFGWQDSKSDAFLILYDMDARCRKGLGLSPTSGILYGVLAVRSESSKYGVEPKKFARARGDLKGFKAPMGIMLGDTRDEVFKKCGKGQLNGKNKNRECYNWYDLEGYRKKPRPKNEPHFIMQLTFVSGKLVNIYIFEES